MTAALTRFDAGDTDGSCEALLAALDGARSTDEQRMAFGAATWLLHREQPREVVAWLEARTATEGTQRPWALRALVAGYGGAGRTAEARRASATLAADYAGAEHERHGLGEGVRLALRAGDHDAAVALLAALEALYPEAVEAEIAGAIVAAATGLPTPPRPEATLEGVAEGPEPNAKAAPIGGGVALSLPKPNPSRGATTLTLTLPTAARVEVRVVDLLGREVATVPGGVRESGRSAVEIATGALPRGTLPRSCECGARGRGARHALASLHGGPMRRCLLLIGVAAGVAALLPSQGAAQMLPPGAGFEWEPLGVPSFDGRLLAVSWEGEYWSAGSDLDHPSGNYRYDEPTDTWMRVTSLLTESKSIAFLGPDTLLVQDFPRIKRSDDGGETWRGEYRAGSNRVLYAVPLSLPVSGGLVLTDIRGGTDGLAYSLDRGRTFAPGAYDPALFGTDDIRAWTVRAVTRGGHAGRLVQGGIHGVALSDDGGRTWRPSGLWELFRYGVIEVGEVVGPEGQPRLLAELGDSTLPHGRVAYSDDGGETWSTPVALPDAQDGGVGYGGGLFVPLAPVGLPRSVVAVMARGYVYRTDDGGRRGRSSGRCRCRTPSRT